MIRSKEEPPPQEEDNDASHRSKRAILLQQQVPINPDGRPLILLTVIPQPTAQLAHALQAITTIEQILDILRHDLGDVPQLIMQLIQILRRARVAVRRLGAANEAVKVHKRIRPKRRVHELLRRVRRRELARDVGEVCKGELARVRAVRDGHVHNVGLDQVVERVLRAALDACLWFRGACKSAEDQLHLRLDFAESRFGGFVVDGGAEHEAYLSGGVG